MNFHLESNRSMRSRDIFLQKQHIRARFHRIVRKAWSAACSADGIVVDSAPFGLFSPLVGAKYDKRVHSAAYAADKLISQVNR
jgi:hypothetical protein